MLKEVIVYFFRLGFLGFGGPLAIVASIQKDLVESRKWVSIEKFQNTFALIKAMPGPIALMSAVYVGRERAGTWGGIAAGITIILPAFFLMLVLAVFIDKFEQSPLLMQILLGMQIAALAVILLSIKGIVRGFEKDKLFWVIAFISFILNYFASSWEPAIIIGFGVLLALISSTSSKKPSAKILLVFFLLIFCFGSWSASALAQQVNIDSLDTQNAILHLIWVCFKAGAFVFGSGLAIVPMLQSDVVDHYHWMTQSQFMNAVALGQITPGPVLITSTAIGFHVAGVIGATLATFFIFFPSFFNMMTWFPSANNWLHNQTWIKSFSRGAIGAVTGSILFSILKISMQIEWKISMVIIFAAVIGVGFKTKTPTWLMIILSGPLYRFLLLFA